MKRVPLLQYYSEIGAEIGEFAGWITPLWFTSNKEEHLAVRSSVGIFDITHMTRIAVRGEHSEKLLQQVLTIDVEKLKPGKMKYCLMCSEEGKIIDDLTVFRHPTDRRSFIIVCNAITHDKVLRILDQLSQNMDVEITDLTFETSLYAVQGPRSLELISRFCEMDLSILKWFTGVETKIDDVNTLITRSGYTGENGYELMLWSWELENLRKIWNKIVKLGSTPCGLAARDSLRLEAGYPLYGQDIDENVSPVEARLTFAIDFSKEYFIGKEAIERAISEGKPRRLLVGFKAIEKIIPRRGYRIVDKDNQVVGEVTSGGFSFTLGVGIGLGYVNSEYANEGERLKLEVKDKYREVEVTLEPIVSHKMKHPH
ncbi:MAG: glycine cleavage system aminomethyltransferase GcvT [Aigarchaeota archaeon]|nr:glycine cleavage system aminomethyltransferase GcvT [Aigarchaeota archaeon]MCX8193238.1 glycine cleavage system aminomethyltransferase GcvT [Nitrososphaeria archaeon]MDW7986378.1 glycine cleavage system aminomethyltransferase GcvT [Nitrososphaerota archaeon]